MASDLVCDFCGGPWPEGGRSFKAVDYLSHIAVTDTHQAVSEGAWAACPICANLIDIGDWDQLARRAAESYEAAYGLPDGLPSRFLETAMRELHDEFRRAML